MNIDDMEANLFGNFSAKQRQMQQCRLEKRQDRIAKAMPSQEVAAKPVAVDAPQDVNPSVSSAKSSSQGKKAASGVPEGKSQKPTPAKKPSFGE